MGAVSIVYTIMNVVTPVRKPSIIIKSTFKYLFINEENPGRIECCCLYYKIIFFLFTHNICTSLNAFRKKVMCLVLNRSTSIRNIYIYILFCLSTTDFGDCFRFGKPLMFTMVISIAGETWLTDAHNTARGLQKKWIKDQILGGISRQDN